MKKNTLSGKEYLWNYLFWGVIGYIWYQNLLFTNIEGMTVFQSNLVLIGSMVLGFIINTVLSVQWSRNTFSIINSMLIPFGIYTFITYNPYLSNLYKPLLIVAGIIFVSGIAVAVFAKVNSTNRRRIRMIRKRRSVIAARTVGAITSAVIIGCIFGRSYIGGALISSQECTTSTYGDEYTIANNIDTVLLLKPENWDKVSSAQERLDILQCVVNIEGNFLGLNKEVHIYSKMLDEGVLGYYSERESAVYISAKHLMRDSIYDILDTVGHEMYHAAEHRYVEIYNNLSPEDQASYFFYDASIYAEEFSNYVSGKDDFITYYGQKCEKDARSYGRSAVGDYYSRISELTGDNSFDEYVQAVYGIGLDGGNDYGID